MGLWVGGHAGLKGGEQWEGAGLSQRGAAEVQGLGEHQQAAAGGAGGAGLVTRRPMAVMGAENRCRGWARGEATPTCPGWGWLGQRTAEESQPERERPSEDRAILFLSHLGPRQAKWAGAAGGKAARARNSSALWYGEGGVGGVASFFLHAPSPLGRSPLPPAQLVHLALQPSHLGLQLGPGCPAACEPAQQGIQGQQGQQ